MNLWIIVFLISGEMQGVNKGYHDPYTCAASAYEMFLENEMPKDTGVYCALVSPEGKYQYEKVNVREWFAQNAREIQENNTEEKTREYACNREKRIRESSKFGTWQPTWYNDGWNGKKTPQWLIDCTYGG